MGWMELVLGEFGWDWFLGVDRKFGMGLGVMFGRFGRLGKGAALGVFEKN